jgi:hypothetical protein
LDVAALIPGASPAGPAASGVVELRALFPGHAYSVIVVRLAVGQRRLLPAQVNSLLINW